MLNSALRPGRDEPRHEEVEAVARGGPRGAVAVAGIATVIVLAIWLAFYLFVFLPQSAP
ncbi:MAG: hypothetical protein JSS04_29185 [Proteobacteria bacterium]|nr:hypothetical protein [Pseudomonadota bacterium]